MKIYNTLESLSSCSAHNHGPEEDPVAEAKPEASVCSKEADADVSSLWQAITVNEEEGYMTVPVVFNANPTITPSVPPLQKVKVLRKEGANQVEVTEGAQGTVGRRNQQDYFTR